MSSNTKIHNKTIHDNELENFVKNLRDGDRKTVPNDKIFLVLGVTGTGKSTFVQYIAGDNTKLHSVELGEGSGEFIIVDGNRISNLTSISKTIIPEHIYDPKTDTHFYDCPGFSDTRSAYADITATYLIKKLVNQSKEIKIAFTVNYPSVRQSVDRHAFMEFVTHAISLMKDFRKYRNSIALIVTKVDYELTRGKIVPDNMVIKKIGNFLVGIRDEQQQKLDALDNDNQKDRNFYEKAIDFIDCLATKENDQYNRIALFRRPDDTGPLSELESLQEGKKKILELLHQKLIYTKVSRRDFGFTISDKSQNQVYDIIQYLNDEVHRSIHLLIDKMKAAYELQIKDNFEKFPTLNDKFNKDYARILKTMDMINDNTGIRDFLLILLELLEALMLQIPESDFQDVIDINSYIIFLRIFNKDGLKTTPYRLKETLTSFENFVDEWKIWTSFLYKINMFLSDYSVQNNNDLMHDTYKALNDGNYIEYLETIDTFDKQILYDVSRVKMDELKTSMLTKLIKLRMQIKVEKKCPNVNKVRIEGEFIKFSEIDSVPCWNSKVNSIEIFASDTIYIDTDFINSKWKVHNLTIIAPTWNVIGKRQIILDGSSGSAHSTIQAKSGTSSSVDGLDGLPGKPGMAGGAFLGIGMKFINSENLRITSNGGAGGPGQNGGNGADGVNGKKISLPSGGYYEDCNKKNFEISNGRYEVTAIHRYIDLGGFNSALYQYNGYGKSGTRGGNGGNGGKGGLGGYAGEIEIIELGKPSKITRAMTDGAIGSPGIGGRGGSGGWNSRTIVECSLEVAPFVYWPKWTEKGHIEKYRHLENGLSGRIDANALNMEYPDPGTAISDPSHIIISYKKFMKEKLKNTSDKNFLLKFLKKFESNTYISKYSNNLEFNLQSEANKTSNELDSPYKELRLKLTSSHNDEKLYNLRTRRSIISENVYGTDQNVVTPFENSVSSLILKSNFHSQFHPNSEKLSSYNKQQTETGSGSGTGTILYDFNQHTFNSILLLGDLVIRKFTNGKYYYHGKCEQISNNAAQALTLNILNDYERILRENIPNKFLFNYNPIKIQKKIMLLIINNRCADVPKYLTDVAITYYFESRKNYDAFSKTIYKICDKYLAI